ncbi:MULTISPECIES: ATP-binding protein [Streptomyces]|uniref:ATP-binding protein n=1 Tax=Streptomyces TaxID=1883 RepID=UPI002E778CE7|nr:ATP-binding protein [Streptomyces sp. GSL17-113]
MDSRTTGVRQGAPPRGTAPAQFTVRLSSTPRGARLARLSATRWLDEHGVPFRGAASRTAAVVVAELASNAVRHCGGTGRDFRLRLVLGVGPSAAGGTLRVEVTDARADKRLPPGLPQSSSGRGLVLVNALAERWGVRVNDAVTKTVWAQLRLPAGSVAVRGGRERG